MLASLPRQDELDDIALLIQIAAAFSVIQADRLLRYPFRGLLNVYSRSGLRTRRVTQGDPLHRSAFNGKLHFFPLLRLLPAGATSCRVGFAPTENRRLFTAH